MSGSLVRLDMAQVQPTEFDPLPPDAGVRFWSTNQQS